MTHEAPGKAPVAARSVARRRPTGRALVAHTWEWVTVAVLAVGLFRIGFGSLRRLSVVLGTGDLLPVYAVDCLWTQGRPTGGTHYGFPFGMDLLKFPTSDAEHSALAALIGAVSGNCVLGTNAVFALSFPFTALASLWVLRLVRLRGPLAVVLALAVTTVPFHWLRLPHIFLSTMYPVILGVGLALLTGSGEAGRVIGRGGRWYQRAALVGVALVVGLGGIYYAFFAVLLCGVAVGYRAWHGVGWREVARSLVPAVMVAAVLGASLVPAWVDAGREPSAAPVADRLPVESVMYAGVLAGLLVPSPEGLPSPLAGIAQRLDAAAGPVTDAGVLVGDDRGSLVTTSALVFAVIGGLVLARRRGRAARSPTAIGAQDGEPAPALVIALLVTSLLFFVPWGLNFLFAVYVSPQLRAWDRWVPVILLLFVVLAARTWCGLGLRTSGLMPVLVAAGLLAVIVLESALPYRAGFDRAASSGQALEDAGIAYATELNGAVPGSCAVLQLPYVPYPEGAPRQALGTYDPLVPALTNQDKQWTVGAMRGTVASSWLERLDSTLAARDVAPLAAAGFCAVHVDLRGYAPAAGSELVTSLTGLLGAPVATGLGGSWLAYRLPAANRGPDVDANDLAQLPSDVRGFFAPALVSGSGSLPLVPEINDLDRLWWTSTPGAALSFVESDPHAPFDAVHLTIRAPACGARTVELMLTAEGRSTRRSVDLGAGQQTEVEISAGRGVASATLAVDVTQATCAMPDGRAVGVALVDPESRSS